MAIKITIESNSKDPELYDELYNKIRDTLDNAREVAFPETVETSIKASFNPNK